MSNVLTEYLSLIPKALRNSQNIVEGIVNRVKLNFGHLPEDEQKEITRRLFICQSCPFMSANAKNNPSINYQSERLDDHCIHCSCNIDLKTSCLNCKCGIEAYNKTEQGMKTPLELKWTIYQKPNEDGL